MSSNPEHGNADPAGPAGTVRLNATPTGPAGTARIDATPAGPSGTARIDAGPVAAAGPAGTARIDTGTQAAGPAGTARIEAAAGPAGTARVGAPAPAAVDAAQAPEAGQHLMNGQTVQLHGASYQVESTLSTTTGEARTYVVTDGAKRFVLKHYRPGLRAPLAALGALQAQPHPNVVAIHDFGSEAGQDFELLEYFPAGTLDQLLRRDGPLQDLERLRRLVRHLADGLEHLHERVGLIYQDLKPENILISGPDLERVVMADFGISSLRKPGSSEVQVIANGTREYAAPELARFGNETQTLVTEKVDYFALGITLLECWQGQPPFQGVPGTRRAALVQDREVPFPPGMDASLETLIKGLLSPSAKQRFGPEQVRRWVNHQALEVDYTRTERVYERLAFRGDEYYQTPAELAALLEKYPALGVDYLYLGTIGKWLEGARDMELATQIEKIVRQFDQDDAQRQAGLLRAVYTLDAARPFVTAGGRSCLTGDDLGNALLAEQAHYVQALTQPFDPFYLYLQARGEGEFATETRAQFLGKQGAQLAFNQLIYALHSGGRNRVQILDRYYFLPEDLADAPAEVQQALRAALNERHSRVLLWLQRLGIVEQLEALPQAQPADQLSVMRAFPWLRLAEFVGDLPKRQGAIAHALLKAKRLDLLDEFIAQGLDFNAPAEEWKPLVTAAANNNLPAVTFMLDHGADLEVVDADGDTALAAAVRFRRKETVTLLLDRGASIRHVRPDGHTLLGLALIPGQTQKYRYPVDPALVQRMLEAGVDANQPSGGDGRLPLHLALVSEQRDHALPLLEMLLAHGADIQRPGPNLAVNGQPPCNALFTALYAFHFQHADAAAYLPVIERLLKAGARVDTLDQGKAPLHWAALWSQEGLVQLLLAHGARRDQVGDGAMLPATYARMRKATALEPLLAPGAGLAWRGRFKQLGATVLKALTLAALVLPLLTLGNWLLQSRALAHADGATLGLVFGELMLILLAMRATLDGSWKTLGARLKAALRSLGGWVRWLVLGPALLGGGGLLAAAALQAQSGMSAYRLSALQGWGLVALFAGLVLTALSVWVSGRARNFAEPYEKYLAAGGSGKSQGRFGALALTLGLTGVILLPVYGLLQGSGTGMRAEPQAATTPELGNGSLLSNFIVRDNRGPVCTLPPGTTLTGLRPAPNNWPEPRWYANVPKPPARCGTRLTNVEVAIPLTQIRRGNTPAEPPAPSTGKAANGAPARAPAAQPVAGTVQGLSAEGWPQIDGRALPLHGIAGITTSQRGRFEGWLASHDNHLSCEPVSGGGGYRCLTARQIDVAEALLLNGVASLSPEAPAQYKDAQAQAMAAKRGQWK
ncbi:ankyrin repeat domain-containing protein [Pelomonas sp. CA6]|uniref:protein kinase domain-containing protein n=1 Tax=Pelomonas sp. CA6 TaxID=2907999 RepID=UPI001F4A3B76|nr:ankyrin repeat domain-containing protein [Pelomonas sp. CA6]MCH7342260.1 ankyrin repeat domain-containing protein [Pelomonas sp. CA6]